MLDLSGYPALDKHALVGGCVRLRVRADAQRLGAELDALPARFWGTRGGRVGVHAAAESIFLRGHAPAEGALPIEDREALAQLPYVRSLINDVLPGEPMRCLLAKLPAGARIAPHIDRAPYFHQTIRLHVPIATNSEVLMLCAGSVYRMAAGEIWSINNVAVHGAWNRHATESRTHLICDFVPDARMLALLAQSERDLGVVDPVAEAGMAT
jgi:hypothetical protein